MDRSIPHVRDIFSSRKKSSDSQQELCLYDKSPRSRRKLKNSDDFFDRDQPNHHSDHTPAPTQQSVSRKKSTGIGDKENHNSKTSSDDHRPDSDRRHNNNNRKNNSYSSKTLTERDIRHLERHLSMKKTIRKQISRNLAQAFVDDPNLFSTDNPEPPTPTNNVAAPKPTEKKNSGKGGGVTLTRAKIAKSEQNVLDLLKVSIEDRDSGHSSPTNDGLEDEDDDYDDTSASKGWRSTMKRRSSQTKALTESDSRSQQKEYGTTTADKKSSSIWKMFSSRNKNKR